MVCTFVFRFNHPASMPTVSESHFSLRISD
jgi:hypothetical protein